MARYESLEACAGASNCVFNVDELAEYKELSARVAERQRQLPKLLEQQKICKQTEKNRLREDESEYRSVFCKCVKEYSTQFARTCAGIGLEDGLTLRYLATGSKTNNHEMFEL